jgi:RND family efflux transporter MFP subunit
MKRHYFFAAAFALAATLFFAGHPALAAGEAPETATSGAETFIPKPASRSVTLTGFTRPRTTMTLVSEESGQCVEVLADVGDAIGKDGVFARLDDSFVVLDLEKNRAEQKRLAANLAFYENEVKRYEKLVSADSAARRDLEEDVRVLAGAKHELEALRIGEKAYKEHLRRHTLRAPAGWKVVERYLEPGEWVKSGDKAAELGRFDVLMIPYALTIAELSALKAQGGEIGLEMTDIGKKARARIERISPDFDPDSRKINVDMIIETNGFDFRGGLRAEMTLEMPDPGGALLVPKKSLLKAYEEFFLIRPDGERVKTVLLGQGPEGLLRVSVEGRAPGEAFLANPGS